MDEMYTLSFYGLERYETVAQTIIDGIKQLKAGINMVIFPEGTRSKGAPVGEFKAGSFKLATKSKALLCQLLLTVLIR